MDDIINSSPPRYSLCQFCIKRQGLRAGSNGIAEAKGNHCFICGGISSRLETNPLTNVVRRLKKYGFRSFAVGVILPQGVQEREDQLRSKIRIRGKETIKSELGSRIADAIAEKLKKTNDRFHPDLNILINLAERNVEINSKSLFLYGLYTKPRGVAQRRLFCEECDGRGCDKCNNSGYSSTPSVEGAITKKLNALLGSKKCKYTWYGSEDIDSIVFPPGRPFIVEAKNPLKRGSPKKLALRTGSGAIVVSRIRSPNGKLEQPTFSFKTRALISSDRPIDAGTVSLLERNMKNVLVQYKNTKGRLVYKKVYSVKATKRNNHNNSNNLISAEIKLDGGLPVKRLISGDSVSPSFSESVQIPLRCERFDIVRVWPGTKHHR